LSKNRFRHWLTTLGAVSNRRAIPAVVAPSAAYKIIFARTTTMCGSV
jgi:hypothetical protein